ncbi:hypothetical protein BPORC_1769 [Bifidobacterium porcinum]|nr:hypothetical protein BPORC_1769 [Bifidobacterium porcinum]
MGRYSSRAQHPALSSRPPPLAKRDYMIVKLTKMKRDCRCVTGSRRRAFRRRAGAQTAGVDGIGMQTRTARAMAIR